MRLFTPVSAKEADRLERGVPLDGALYWTDRPVPEEADDDAIWMVVTIPNEDLEGAIEQPVHPGLGYREFELPPGLPAKFPVERLDSVTADYPRLLLDRQVVVVRDGRPEPTRLRGWLDGHDGPMPAYRIELATRVGNYTCPYTATAPDIFEALVRLRRQLEPDGLRVAVQGARRDTYPSGMARDMGGGMRVYVMRPGRQARLDDLVGTFEDAQLDQIATVDEQRAFFEAWLAGPKN